MTVLRSNELIETTVTPKRRSDGRAVIGIGVGLDVENPVVAATADVNMLSWPPDLPRGAEIIAIAGKKVENYFDIAAVLEAKQRQNSKDYIQSRLKQRPVRFYRSCRRRIFCGQSSFFHRSCRLSL